MRAIWSGTLSFGLINIPVKLYSASEEQRLKFRLLEKEGLCPIHYARVCRRHGKEVPYGDIVKGYEYQKGEYVVLQDEDFEKANVRKTKSIQIHSFAKAADIDPEYFKRPYYLEPEEGTQKAYALFREALKRSGKIGVASFVLRNRELLGIVEPKDKVLVLNEIRYAPEVRDWSKLNLPEQADWSSQEMDLALAFINQLTEGFAISKYKDTYTRELKRIVEAKLQGRIPEARGSEPRSTDMQDLFRQLQRSLKHTKVKQP